MPGLIKPARWALTPAFVDPKWGWFYPTFYNFPFWDAYDYGRRIQLTSVGTPSLVGAESGQAIDFDGTGDYFRHITSEGTAELLKDWSLTFYFQTTKTTQQSMVGVFNSGTGTAWNCTLNHDEDGNSIEGKISVQVRTDSGNSSQMRGATTSAISNLTDGKPHIVTCMGQKVLGSPDGIQIYFDGVKQAITYSVSSPAVDLSNLGFDLGVAVRNIRDSFDIPFGGQIYYIAVQARRLSEEQVTQLHADPFGPFRMSDEVGVVVVPAVAGDFDTFAKRLCMMNFGE